MTNVLFVDDLRSMPRTVVVKRDIEFSFTIARSFTEAIHHLMTAEWDVVSLDHDLGEKDTGYDIIKWMGEKQKWPREAIWVHSANPVGSVNILQYGDRYAPCSVERVDYLRMFNYFR